MPTNCSETTVLVGYSWFHLMNTQKKKKKNTDKKESILKR